jgi:hypothetical protein
MSHSFGYKVAVRNISGELAVVLIEELNGLECVLAVFDDILTDSLLDGISESASDFKSVDVNPLTIPLAIFENPTEAKITLGVLT